ncbi:hypothetical protein HK104_010415 [Borealophlyctis nickersoniae]|nr:hypothetical protein HK104_010415 [Borealophlyctis nickersoniae]
MTATDHNVAHRPTSPTTGITVHTTHPSDTAASLLPDWPALLTARHAAHAHFTEGRLHAAYNTYSQSLAELRDPIALLERAMVVTRMHFPEIALADLLDCEAIFDSYSSKAYALGPFFALAESPALIAAGTSPEIDTEKIPALVRSTYQNLYQCLVDVYTKLQLYKEAAKAQLQFVSLADSKNVDALKPKAVHLMQLAQKYPNAGRLKSTRRYPWDTHNIRDLDCSHTLAAVNAGLSEVGSVLVTRSLHADKADISDSNTDVTQFGFFTAREYVTGETLLQEPELLCVVTSNTACRHCGTSLTSPPHSCPHCSLPFCSPNCLEHAQSSYHLALCTKDITRLLDIVCSAPTTKSLNLLHILKLFSIALFTNTHPLDLPFARHLSPISYESNKHKGFSTTSIQTFKLITSILDIPPDDQRFEFWVYLSLDNMLTCNTFAVRGDQGGSRGYLLPLTAMINHNCVPNAKMVVDGGVARVVAVREIGVGEEVFLSYVDVEDSAGDFSRRDRLLNGWGFICRCDKCLENE